MTDFSIPNFHYAESDFIYMSPTWSAFNKNPRLSRFDELLGRRWQEAMDNGMFNYSLDEHDLKSRIMPGHKKYYLVENVRRGQLRRTPEVISDVNMPFDPDKFHFNKVKTQEILMNFCPAAHHSDEMHIINNANNKQEEPDCSQHQIIINSSPFSFGHCLLVPDKQQMILQRVTLSGVKLSIEMLLLSGHPGFRIGFNGLCAFASVNHQHLHGWYLNYQLYTEHAAVEHISGLCHRLAEEPSKGFVFQLHGSSVSQLAQSVFAVTDYLQRESIAHNMFLTRGVVFGEKADSSKRTIRVYVWPRKPYAGQKNIPGTAICGVFNVAVAELAGHIPMYFPERFDDLTEEEATDRIQEAMLPDDQFQEVCVAVNKLMQNIGQLEKTAGECV